MSGINHIYFFFGFMGWGRKFHKTAIECLNRGIAKEFSGITFGLDSYLFMKDQKDIKYKILDAHEDLFQKYLDRTYDKVRINDLEKRYGSLWKYAYADRQLVTYHYYHRYAYYDLNQEQILTIVSAVFDYYEDLAQKHNIDTFITYVTGGIWAVVAEAVARYFKLNYFELISARYPDITTMTTGYDQSALALNNKPSEQDRQKAIKSLEMFRVQPTKPGWFSKNRFIETRKTIKTSKIFNFLKESSFRDIKKYEFDFDIYSPLTLATPIGIRIKQWLLFRIRLFLLNKWEKYYFDTIPTENSKIVFFPLHTEPESSTLVRAPYYINQKAIIENIAKSLPADYVLYVKEHPFMHGQRPLSFFKELKCIPNVRILPAETDSLQIIKLSSLVIVITSTSGLEAALLGKPVITLGASHYNLLSNIRYFNKHISELADFIRETLDTFEQNDQAIIDYLATIFANSVNLDIPGLYNLDGEVYGKQIVEGICQLLEMYLNKHAKIRYNLS